MAYTDAQRRMIALEIARSGGNLAAALSRLRSEYETFRKVSLSTLRRFMAKAGFTEIVAEQGKVLREAQAEAVKSAERERVINEVKGSIVDRLASDERLLDEARARLEPILKDPEKVPPQMALRAFDRLATIIDRRRAQMIPAVAETKQATFLIEAVMEEAVQTLGQAKAKRFIVEVRERYEAKVRAAEGANDAQSV